MLAPGPEEGDPQRYNRTMTKPAADGALLEKIRSLSPDRLAEVEDFVDFLAARDQDQLLTKTAARTSEAAFRAVWDNADDAEYDRL